MKQLVIPILAVVLLFMSSCFCKGPYEVIGVDVVYQNLAGSSDVYVIREFNNANSIADMDYVKTVSEGDNSITLFPFERGWDSINLENFNQYDTLSDFAITRGKCDNIKNYSFYFNSLKKTSNTIEVNL